ncbi:MAG: type II toxin-antitoxin system HipA family toxin [bacterium]|nr:type II toxin-antitoxin system HipA family toxin [bacterium]
MYERVVKLDVFLWGRHVGALAPESGSSYVFQYDPAFVKTGIEISPFMLPLRTEMYHTARMELPLGAFWGLPGVFADALPDTFGNALINEWMKEQRIPTTAVSALDRLAYVGDRAMGALTFEPRRGPQISRPSALDMRELVSEARLALNNRIGVMKGCDALREILHVGTSAGGAQAKAVVGWNRATDQFLAGIGDLPDGFEHWLIKFSPLGMEDVGDSEYAIHRRALEAGIVMSECTVYELDGVRHFMTRRFDRDGNRRHHLQTYCALKHLPHQSPRQLMTYEGLFHTAVDLGLGYEALEQLFRRMAFNVYIEEVDDHTKNFSFLMREGGAWELAPAYDLTGYHFSVEDKDFEAWSNPHVLSINGKTSGIGDADLLSVAERFGIGTAKRALAEVKAAVGR